MDLKIEQIYGYPVGIVNLNKNLYNKKNIIKSIESNFKTNKKRNKWDGHTTNIHHAYGDWQNPVYKKVDFKTLFPLYDAVIKNYLGKLFTTPVYEYRFDVVNYTCMHKSGEMGEHVHSSDFTMVHYIQFDKLHHKSTCFCNPYPHANYLYQLSTNLIPLFNDKNPVNCWAFKEWYLDIKEDDLIINPGVMKHKVNLQDSKKKSRITIVVNLFVNR